MKRNVLKRFGKFRFLHFELKKSAGSCITSVQRSGRQFAYQSAGKVLVGLLRRDVFAKQTGLIGNSTLQLL